MRASAVPLLSVVVVVLLSSTAPLAAQVTASQAPTPRPSVDQEICPLQLDFDLAPHLARLRDAPEGATVSVSTSGYVCDKARVEHIAVRKTTERPREVLIEVSALLSSEWMRQDVNLTVALIVNGKVVKSDDFRSLTIGNPEANWAARNVAFAGSSSKERGLRFWLKRDKFNEWFSPGSKPSVRVVMEVVDTGEDEEEEE